MEFKVTKVNLKKVESTNRVKAIASIVINNCFAVNDIKVLESEKGLFIVMPNRRSPFGEFRDIAYPINAETREIIQTAVFEEYSRNGGKEDEK